MQPDATEYIRLSVETMIGIGVTAFIAMVSASWVLLSALVKAPLDELKTQFRETNQDLKDLTKVMTDQKGELLVIQQWKVDIDRRMDRLEERQGEHYAKGFSNR